MSGRTAFPRILRLCRHMSATIFTLVFASCLVFAAEPSKAEKARQLFRVAQVAAEGGDFAIAEANLEQAVELAPDKALLFYNLALVREKLGKLTKAKESIEKALSLGLSEADKRAAESLVARIEYGLQKPLTTAHWKTKYEAEGNYVDTHTSESWMKDKNRRVEMQTKDGRTLYIVSSGDVKHVWVRGETTGYTEKATSDYVARIDEIRARDKKIRTEIVDGHTCAVYEEEGTKGDLTFKLTYWLAEDLKNFPVKFVSESGNGKRTYTNWAIEIPATISADMLTPPRDVQFHEFQYPK